LIPSIEMLIYCPWPQPDLKSTLAMFPLVETIKFPCLQENLKKHKDSVTICASIRYDHGKDPSCRVQCHLITQILEAVSCRSVMHSAHNGTKTSSFFCQVIAHEDVMNNNINNYNTKSLFRYNMCNMYFICKKSIHRWDIDQWSILRLRGHHWALIPE